MTCAWIRVSEHAIRVVETCDDSQKNMEYIITLKKKLKKKFFLDFNFPLKKSIKKMEMITTHIDT